jgi:hypothetical protein
MYNLIFKKCILHHKAAVSHLQFVSFICFGVDANAVVLRNQILATNAEHQFVFQHPASVCTKE